MEIIGCHKVEVNFDTFSFGVINRFKTAVSVGLSYIYLYMNFHSVCLFDTVVLRSQATNLGK